MVVSEGELEILSSSFSTCSMLEYCLHVMFNARVGHQYIILRACGLIVKALISY
jgi:hypothetical protein